MRLEKQKQKIIDFLGRNLPYSYNAPTLYKEFKGKMPINTIRSTLRRLETEKKIHRESRGFYKAKVNAETLHFLENPPTLLHGLMTSCETSRKLQKTIQGIPSTNYKDEIVQWFEFMGFKEATTNYRYYKHIWFEDREIVVTFHLKGRIDIYLNCSRHPVSYLEFRDIYNKVNGLLSYFEPFKDQRVIQIGVAKDFMQLQLDGIDSLSLKNFSNAWCRIYKKESIGATRIEHHIKANLSLEDAIKMLATLGTPPVDNNISRPDERRDVT